MIYVQTCFNLSLVLNAKLWCLGATCRGSTFLQWSAIDYPPLPPPTPAPHVCRKKVPLSSSAVFFSFSERPAPPPLIGPIVYTGLTLKLLDVKVKWGNITWFQNAKETRFLFTSSLPYVFFTLSIALQTDDDELFAFNVLFYSLQHQMLSLTGVIIVFFFRDEKKEGVATQKWFLSHNDSRGKSVLTWEMLKCFTLDSLPGSKEWQWNFFFVHHNVNCLRCIPAVWVRARALKPDFWTRLHKWGTRSSCCKSLPWDYELDRQRPNNQIIQVYMLMHLSGYEWWRGRFFFFKCYFIYQYKMVPK